MGKAYKAHLLPRLSSPFATATSHARGATCISEHDFARVFRCGGHCSLPARDSSVGPPYTFGECGNSVICRHRLPPLPLLNPYHWRPGQGNGYSCESTVPRHDEWALTRGLTGRANYAGTRQRSRTGAAGTASPEHPGRTSKTHMGGMRHHLDQARHVSRILLRDV